MRFYYNISLVCVCVFIVSTGNISAGRAVAKTCTLHEQTSQQNRTEAYLVQITSAVVAAKVASNHNPEEILATLAPKKSHTHIDSNHTIYSSSSTTTTNTSVLEMQCSKYIFFHSFLIRDSGRPHKNQKDAFQAQSS